ncbi:MAG: ribosome-associated translation inhibitor RaiA [Candidatus Omnitrophota bacterium]
MQVDITARHFDVTEALKTYIGDKVAKVEKYSLKVETVHVVLEVQKFYHIAEISVCGKNLRLTARDESTDMYAAFDKCLGNLELQLRRQHDRVKDHKVRGHATEEETQSND